VDGEPHLALYPPPPRRVGRAAAGFLLILMAAGSMVLWIGVPAGCLWLAAHVARTSGEALVIGLPITILAMIAFGAFLAWLNRLYLRVTGSLAYWRAEEEEFGRAEAPRYLRGPLELMLVVSLVVALIALFVWFFVFAHNPSLTSTW
jgi:hypothetical protein